MRTVMIKFTIVLLIGLLFQTNAVAYVSMGVTWPDAQIPVKFEIANELSGDLTDGVALETLKQGFQTWASQPCTYIAFSYQGRTTTTSFGVNDFKNVVSWRESNWPDSKWALAVTSVLGSQYSGIIDADMIFNGVHFSWSTTGSKSRMDLQSVVTHEAGHFLGLDHSSTYAATMYASTGSGETQQRDLHSDDIAGVCALYPTGSYNPPAPKVEPKVGDSCTSTFTCGNVMACVNDGKEKYCTQSCAASGCPSGYTCYESNSGAVCVKSANFPAPVPEKPKATFGQTCTDQVTCDSGLVCVNDAANPTYCTQKCTSSCPSGYACVSAGTTQVCVKAGTTSTPSTPETPNPPTNSTPTGTVPATPLGNSSGVVNSPTTNTGVSNPSDTPPVSPAPTQNLNGKSSSGCQLGSGGTAPIGLGLWFVLFAGLLLWRRREETD